MSDTPAAAGPIRLAHLGPAVVAALVASGAIIVIVASVRGADADAWRGIAAGTVAMLVAAAASIVPLMLGARFGLMGVVGGFFAGSFVRAAVAIGLCLVAMWVLKYPEMPTLLSMAVHYLAVLAAETIVIGRAIWNKAA